MTGKWFAFSVLALSLGATGSYTAKAWATPPTPATPTLVQDRDDHWDAPPEEFRDVQALWGGPTPVTSNETK